MSQTAKVVGIQVNKYTRCVYVTEVSDLRLSTVEREELMSSKHDYTILLNAKRTIAHILLKSFRAESHLRMKFHPSFFRSSSADNIRSFFLLKLGHGI